MDVHECLTHGLNVTRETVRLIVEDLDPDGVSRRQRRRLLRRSYFSCGPNYIWHIDGQDKLKPFGICISGCIYGFSRKIIWLNAGKTNNNPKVIGGNYLSAVIRLKVCLRVVRADFEMYETCKCSIEEMPSIAELVQEATMMNLVQLINALNRGGLYFEKEMQITGYSYLLP